MLLRTAATATCVVLLSSTVALASQCFNEAKRGRACGEHSSCCGNNTVTPYCVPTTQGLQCCTKSTSAAVCGPQDGCCGGSGPFEPAFCCPPQSSCCAPSMPGHSSCCPLGSVCCNGEASTVCCGAEEKCHFDRNGAPSCVNPSPLPPSNTSAVPAGAVKWVRDATPLAGAIAYAAGVVATVVQATNDVVAIDVQTGKTIWTQLAQAPPLAKAPRALAAVTLKSGRRAFYTEMGTFDARSGDIEYVLPPVDQTWEAISVVDNAAVYWTFGDRTDVVDMTTGKTIARFPLANLGAVAPGPYVVTFTNDSTAVVYACDLSKEHCRASSPVPVAAPSALMTPNAAASIEGSQRIPGWPFVAVAAGHRVTVVECGHKHPVAFNLTTTLSLPPLRYDYGAVPCSVAAVTATNVVVAASCNGELIHAFDLATRRLMWDGAQPTPSIAAQHTPVQVVPFAAKYVLATAAVVPDGAVIVYTDRVVVVWPHRNLSRTIPLSPAAAVPKNVGVEFVGPVTKPCLQLTLFPRVVCVDVMTGATVWSGPSTSPEHRQVVAGPGTSVLLEETRLTAFNNAV